MWRWRWCWVALVLVVALMLALAFALVLLSWFALGRLSGLSQVWSNGGEGCGVRVPMGVGFRVGVGGCMARCVACDCGAPLPPPRAHDPPTNSTVAVGRPAPRAPLPRVNFIHTILWRALLKR